MFIRRRIRQLVALAGVALALITSLNLLFVLKTVGLESMIQLLDHGDPMPATTSRRSYDVDWKAFDNAPDLHNTTVDGRPIPGLFREGTLYLLGARLTVSYQDESVFATLIGLAQDPWPWDDEERCELQMGDFSYSTVVKSVSVFCQVECSNGLCERENAPMQHIHSVSIDSNQNNLTLVWTANLSYIVTRDDLKRHPNRALRLHFWTRAIAHNDTVPLPAQEPLAVVDIPMSTLVVGQAGPQIAAAYPLQQTVPKNNVSLCVAIHDERAPQYLPEFIQHHSNLGFAPIVIGMNTGMGSDVIQRLSNYLSPFLQSGKVALMASGGHGCNKKAHQVFFYSHCLYHSKGLSEYMAIWDFDEYWMSPNVTDTNVVTVMENIQSYQESNGCGQRWCFHSFPSQTVFLRRGGDLHINGSYRKFSVVSKFHHRANSFEADWSKSITRTKYAYMGGIHLPTSCMFDGKTLMGDDFMEWSDTYYEDGQRDQYMEHCRNLRIKRSDDGDTAPYGTMHHFASLIQKRDEWDDSYEPFFPVDEYVEHFGESVFTQVSTIFSEDSKGASGTMNWAYGMNT